MHMPLQIPSRKPSLRRAGGFTLIELLIVMVILGLLASLVGPRLFGQLDASISYDVTPNITASVDATNLLNTRRETFFGLDSRPRDYSVVDRRFGATLRVNY